MRLVDIIGNIEDKVYIEYNTNCRLYGDDYIKMVIRMAQLIIEQVNIEDLTDELQEQLTDYNYHQANHAIDMIKSIDKFSYRQYLQPQPF